LSSKLNERRGKGAFHLGGNGVIRLRGDWLAILWAALFSMLGVQAKAADKAAPLVIGETFTINSKILSETRRINVYVPPGYSESRDVRVPVLYMPDGGIAEDFLHIAGLIQVSVSNATIDARNDYWLRK
jgi:enterochelin esterase-like enzyme